MSVTTDVISLPQIPKDRSYEDYVAAYLNAGGYYLERGVHLKEEGEILELDIVVNKFEEDKEVQKSIVEVKSGKEWGFPEIFKVKGWLSYLGFHNAAFIVQITNKDMEFYHRVSEQLGINLISTPVVEEKLDDSELKGQYVITTPVHYDAAVACLRFSFALEHKLIDDIVSTCKSNSSIISYSDLRQYIEIINDSSFFEANPKNRIQRIFEAYQKYRNITARIDQEKKGRKYESLTNNEQISIITYSSLFYSCQDTNILYASLYVELQEKLNILKCCVEDILRPTGQKSLFESLSEDVLPSTMKEGMEKLKDKPYFYLYPYFWQIFVFLFGGFILNDETNKPKEYDLLSELTGIPKEHIDDALEAFDLLFPLPDDESWQFDLAKSSITMLRFMPVPLCGIGSNFRRCVYSKDNDFAFLKTLLPKDMTYNDIAKWNNLAAAYLKKSKDVNKQPA